MLLGLMLTPVDKPLDQCGYGGTMGESPWMWIVLEEAAMRQGTASHNPSIASDVRALAGLYRTVFWMIGRRAQYGRIFPPEADMGTPEEASSAPIEAPVFEMPERSAVEVGARE